MYSSCFLDIFLAGSKEDIKAFHQTMLMEFSYSLKPEFLRSIGLDVDDKSTIRLKGARERAERQGNSRALEALEDSNLKAEYFQNIPKGEHFIDVLEYDWNDAEVDHLTRLPNGDYYCYSTGNCATSVEDSLAAIKYDYFKDEIVANVFRGTTLEEFSANHPKLKICIVSTNYDADFSELYYVYNGNIVIEECKDYIESFYESVEKAKEDGMDITEDDVDKCLYVEYPRWFVGDKNEIWIDNDYIFNIMGIQQ